MDSSSGINHPKWHFIWEIGVAVAQSAVNRWVVGSNPTSPATRGPSVLTQTSYKKTHQYTLNLQSITSKNGAQPEQTRYVVLLHFGVKVNSKVVGGQPTCEIPIKKRAFLFAGLAEWQTCQNQNLVSQRRVGSSPTTGTTEALTRIL